MESGSAAVDAKRELTLQLIDLLTPHLYDGIKSIFNTCKTNTSVLRCFQEKLCTIPIWNQDIIDSEFDRITSKKDFEYLDKLLDMLFVSHVKVLSVLKLNESKNKIDIQVPNQKTFVHKCYVECARSFYRDPYLIDDRDNDHSEVQRNVKRSYIVINSCIEKTIRDLIPLKDILEKYSQVLEDEPQSDVDELEDEINDIHLEEANSGDHIQSNYGNLVDQVDQIDTNEIDSPVHDTTENELQGTTDSVFMNKPNSQENFVSTSEYEPSNIQEPNLTVSSGIAPEDTPRIKVYQTDSHNNYPVSVANDLDSGTKSILIHRKNDSYQNGRSENDRSDNDPFFSDEE